MQGRRWLAAAAAVGSMSAGVAVAATESSETTPVTADFNARLVSQSQQACDANHVEFRGGYEGSETSTDPRLRGKFKATVRVIGNIHNGWGSGEGTLEVRDQGNGRLKVRGQVVFVNTPDGASEGFITGQTFGQHPTRLLANFNVQQTENGSIAGEFGKDSEHNGIQDPAVLTDACPGGGTSG